MGKGRAILEQVDPQLERFGRRVMLLALSSKEAIPAIRRVLDQVKEAFEEEHLRFDEFTEEIEAVLASAKDTLGAPVDEF
jgi:hypothetical protein